MIPLTMTDNFSNKNYPGKTLNMKGELNIIDLFIV